MAHIVFADSTNSYDGRDLELRPLGGTETSVIYCARELALRGHRVEVFTNCKAAVEDHGVAWKPLAGPTPGQCDLYIACHQPNLLGFVRRPARRALWVLWPASQLKHYKKIGLMWLYRPSPVLTSLYQARTYSRLLPNRTSRIVIPHGLPDAVRNADIRHAIPARRAIFASNPQRNLTRLLEIWSTSVLPRVPDAVLDIYGINGLSPGVDPWSAWSSGLIPPGLQDAARASINIRAPVSREQLIDAMRESRVLVYLGHKAEAFCLSVAEAQALGLPAVVGDLTVLPERVVDKLTGFVCSDDDEFADATVSLLTDDTLWKRQHEASLRLQRGISWREHAARLEAALLTDMMPASRPAP